MKVYKDLKVATLYNLPVVRFEGIHSVVIHGVEFVLSDPVEHVNGQQLKQDVDEACVVFDVYGKAVVRNLADDPGPATGADVYLPGDVKIQLTAGTQTGLIQHKSFSYLLGHPAALNGDVAA